MAMQETAPDHSLAALYQNPPLTGRILKIALVVQSPRLSMFVVRVIADVAACSFVDAAVVVAEEGYEADTAGSRWQGISYAAFRYFLRHFDRRDAPVSDPLAIADCASLIAPLRRDATWVESADVIVDLREQPGVVESFRVPPGGVWRFRFGAVSRATDTPAFLWEQVDRDPVTVVALECRTPEGDTRVLCEIAFATVFSFSLAANSHAPYWGATHFISRKLRELSAAPASIPAARCGERVAAQWLSPRAKRAPRNLPMLAWMGREIGKRLTARILRGRRTSIWKVGLRSATTPLLRASSPTDLAKFTWLEAPPGHYWADPILFCWGPDTWLFIEDYIERDGKAILLCGRLRDDGRIEDLRPCLERPYHLSYPHVFEHGGDFFMVPESAASGQVELYRAIRFPYEWKLERVLLPLCAVDSTILRHHDRWWLFSTAMPVPGHGVPTLLFSAGSLDGPWEEHAGGPICSDVRNSRGAGPCFVDSGQLIRPSQDCSGNYGRRLNFNVIHALDAEHYREETISSIAPGWMPAMIGVHTYSRAGRWEAIDGLFDMPLLP